MSALQALNDFHTEPEENVPLPMLEMIFDGEDHNIHQDYIVRRNPLLALEERDILDDGLIDGTKVGNVVLIAHDDSIE